MTISLQSHFEIKHLPKTMPARKHFAEVTKRVELARIGSNRMARFVGSLHQKRDTIGITGLRVLMDRIFNCIAGTDAPLGNLRFGESLQRELELLVDARLSPMEAIQAATSRPAQLLKRGDEIGTIQAGKPADLVAVAGNPLQAITNIRNVRIVIRDGRTFDF